MSKDVQEALESAIAEFEKRQLVAMRSSRMIPAIIACKDDRNANADIQGNAPCAGARELYGRFCRQRLAPTNPAIFSGSFQPRARLRLGTTPNPPQSCVSTVGVRQDFADNFFQRLLSSLTRLFP